MDIDGYLDRAAEHIAARSDRALAAALNIAHASISCYRTRRAWPDDDTMLRLANLAGLDAATALLDLNIWRSRSEDTRDRYRSILAKISAAAIAVFMAGTIDEQVSLGVPNIIHYALWRRRKRSTNSCTGIDRAVSNYRARALSPRAAT